MKTAPAPLLLLGVCVLLLSALTVSAVSLSVSPNLQQFFSGPSVVTVSCTDGQTVDGWTVKRIRRGRTEDCGAAADFRRINSSSCVLDTDSSYSAVLWCETRSGQQSDEVSISVSDKYLILEIPAIPVRTGSDVTLRCRKKNGDTVKAHFFIKRSSVGHKSEHVITNVQQSDEGFYSCSTNVLGSSPQSFLRVKDPPALQIDPPPSPPVSSPVTSTLSIHPPASSPPPPPPPPSCLVPVAAGLVSVVLLVLGGVLLLWRKLKGGGGADSVSVGLGGGDGCEEPAEKRVRWSVCLCFSGLFLLTAAGVCVLLLLSALTVPADPPPPPPCVSVIRLFCHLVVFCPYCISTGLLLSICCSRKPAVSMEMTQQNGGGQGLDEEYDDATADVTAQHAF